jgi:hypothetical protein
MKKSTLLVISLILSTVLFLSVSYYLKQGYELLTGTITIRTETNDSPVTVNVFCLRNRSVSALEEGFGSLSGCNHQYLSLVDAYGIPTQIYIDLPPYLEMGTAIDLPLKNRLSFYIRDTQVTNPNYQYVSSEEKLDVTCNEKILFEDIRATYSIETEPVIISDTKSLQLLKEQARVPNSDGAGIVRLTYDCASVPGEQKGLFNQ